MEKTLHLLIGAIGTGKSHYADRLSKDKSIDILSADQIEQHSLSKDDNDIELDIMQNYLDQLDSGKSFILDGLNLTKETRHFYIAHAQKRGYIIHGYDFGPGNEISFNRRLVDARNVSNERWKELADRNKSDYEEPNISEGFEIINSIE